MPPLALITTSQVAERCAVDGSAVRRWVYSGVLTPARVTPGGHYRFNPADVDKLTETERADPPAA